MPETKSLWYLLHFSPSSQEALWCHRKGTGTAASEHWFSAWAQKTSPVSYSSINPTKTAQATGETHWATEQGELAAFKNHAGRDTPGDWLRGCSPPWVAGLHYDFSSPKAFFKSKSKLRSAPSPRLPGENHRGQKENIFAKVSAVGKEGEGGWCCWNMWIWSKQKILQLLKVSF